MCVPTYRDSFTIIFMISSYFCVYNILSGRFAVTLPGALNMVVTNDNGWYEQFVVLCIRLRRLNIKLVACRATLQTFDPNVWGISIFPRLDFKDITDFTTAAMHSLLVRSPNWSAVSS